MKETPGSFESNSNLIEGKWYFDLCAKVNKRFMDAKKRALKLDGNERKFREAELDFYNAENNFRREKHRYDEGDKGYKIAENKFNKAKKKYENAELEFKQPKFNNAVNFVGMELEYDEVILFAKVVLMISFISMIILDVILLMFIDFSILNIILFMTAPTIAVPFGLYIFIALYPEHLAERVRVRSIGRAPEAINYMIMSMRLSPSLNKAIEFAAENTDEPMASGLKKVLWKVYMQEHSNIEDAFLDFAYSWGEWNEDLRRSLYAIRNATLEGESREGSTEGLKRSLDKANDIILSGTKARIENFATSLSGPTTILFALGILLPMVIGAMLPLLALGSLDFNFAGESFTELDGGAIVTNQSDNSLLIIFLMDILFPVVTLGYAYKILGSRPGTASPPQIEDNQMSKQKKIKIVIVSIAIGVTLSLISLTQIFGGFGEIIGTLPIVWGISFGLAWYCLATTRDLKKKRDKIKQMEDEFPDALFQLGSRIVQGNSLEVAFRKTSETMKGTLLADKFQKVSYSLQVTRVPLKKILLDEDMGVFSKAEVPSRNIRATMKTIVEIVQKDPLTAGTTIVGISNYMKDMKKYDRDIKISLGNTVSMMRSTALVFAPLVMGITAALYVLLSDALSVISSSPMVPASTFFLVLGIYLVLTVIIIMYFCTGIEHGDDKIERMVNIGQALPISAVVFTLALLMGQLGIVGV